jgi:hypothetical protein
VDAVETVGVNIIGDTGRATDTGNHADVLLLVVGLREGVQQGVEDGVVATSRTPFDHLVAGEVGFCIFAVRFGNKMSFCHDVYVYAIDY